MRDKLPSGTVTFLFTDLEGSTQLWDTYPEAMKVAMEKHDALLREAVEAHQGSIVKTTGDGLHAVFESVFEGINAALSAQEAIYNHPWEKVGQLCVRMALHTGEAQLREGDYYGTMTNRAARLMSIAHGGQILLSEATAALVQDRLPASARQVNLGEHRLRDLTQPETVFQLSRPPLPEEFPPLRSMAFYPNNLPVRLNNFVGREHEMLEIRRLLGETRLLTLLGPGGTGKTRLMHQVAADVLDDFKEGVWVVELAALMDPDLIVEKTIAVFSLSEQPDRTMHDVLIDYLRYKELLLLLDNCEHIIVASAEFVERLLQSCPKIKIMITSREGLAIEGERIYQVPSLSIPTRRQDLTFEEMNSSEAVLLFADRAQIVRPGFQLTDANIGTVLEICRRLDGIPLAIELAAARMNVLSEEQIAIRLADRFRLLTGGRRTALPRQQTLQALIDWSWNLLDDSECRLLRRLSVFSGSLTLEAAEAIAGDANGVSSILDPLDVLDRLTQLVQKSLVIADHTGEGDTRYWLLESIRQYALIKLLEADESQPVRDRHTKFYFGLAFQAEQHLMGSQMLSWLEHMRREQGNMFAAMEWSLERHPELALRLAGIWPLFQMGVMGSLIEVTPWLEQAINTARNSYPRDGEDLRIHQIAIVRALTTFVNAKLPNGDYVGGREAVNEAVGLARQCGAKAELASALGLRGLIYAFLRDEESARVSAEEAFTLSNQFENPLERAVILGQAGAVFGMISHDSTRAAAIIDDYLRLAQTTGNPFVIAVSSFAKANLVAAQGDYSGARLIFEQAADRFQILGHPLEHACRSEVAHLLRRSGEREKALMQYKKTIAGWYDQGHRPAVAHQLECFAYLAMEEMEWSRAARLLGAAEALRQAAISKRMELEQEEYDRAVVQLREQLGEQAWMDEIAMGRLMTVERAVHFAQGIA